MRHRTVTINDAYYISDPILVKEATSKLTTILDAKYEAADLKEVVKSTPKLSRQEQKSLLLLLRQYEDLFDGNLGKYTGPP